jgi:cytochrome c oxidase subunit III
MSSIPTTASAQQEWTLPSSGKVSMLCLIAAESVIFVIFVVAYLYDIGKSASGPTPAEILKVPIADTICLLSSSLTIHWATRALRQDRIKSFLLLWGVTLALGLKFVEGTATNWYWMIYHQHFTISTSLFGTSFYSLVGLHISHVIIGLTGMSLIFVLTLAGKIEQKHFESVDIFSYYWHFVDAVWVVVFTVVYVIGLHGIQS